MPADHPLDRPRDRPVSRDDRPPAPVYRGRELDFTDSPGREYWWNQLHPHVRTQLLDPVGDIIEWWAYAYQDQPDRPYAVVFGRRGFGLSRPTINERGGRASQLLIWTLREASCGTPAGGHTPGTWSAARPPWPAPTRVDHGLFARHAARLAHNTP